jgi:zinc protease
MRRRIAMLATLVAVACGPRAPAHEPKPGPDDSAPDVAPGVMFLETLSIPPEVRKAIEAQKNKIVDKPAPLGETTYSFPEVTSGRLKNGLAWYLVEDRSLPEVSLNLVVRAGTAHDPDALPGLSVFTGDMLREGGTEKRSAPELAEEIEALGADLSIITGTDYTLVAVDSLSDHGTELVSLMGEMCLTPAFDEEKLGKFRTHELHRLELSRSDPEWVADVVLTRELYGAHPYSRYDTTEESLEATTREDVRTFHESHYTASNSFFIAVGDIEPGELRTSLENGFGKMPKGKPVKIKWPKLGTRDKRDVVIVDRPGSAQTVIRVGNATLRGNHADALPLMVANHVLGGNASSRLFMSLREDKGLTYGCYSHVPMRVDIGAFFVETSTKTASTGESLDAIFAEIDAFLAQGAVSDEELDATRRYLAGVLPIKAQTPPRIADLLIDRFVYGLPDDYYDTYVQRITAVTPAEVHELATSYIHPETAVVVLVGDASQIGKAAARWGEVRVVGK